MKFNRTIALLLTVLFLLPVSTMAVTIKIGSIAPARSPWDKALKELGREWKQITNGAVQLKIYAGGIAGNEEDMIRKMRVGALGGAVLTNRGLTKLHNDVYALNIPFLINNEDELDFVINKMKSTFESAIDKKGFKVIIWSKAGWLNFFSKNPVIYPEDLKKHKLSFATGEPKMEQAWKKSGYHVVPNDLKDLMMGLQSGMVDSFYLPPLLAGSGQYFALAPNMCSMKIAPLFGGIVVSERVWKRIPDKYKEEMMKVAVRMAKKLNDETKRLEKETIDTMKEHGLIVNQVPADALPKWKAESDKGMDALVGKAFSEEIYKQVKQSLEEYRKNNKK